MRPDASIRFRTRRRLTGALLLALAAGCGDSTGPEEEVRPTDELQFVQLAADAPPLVATTMSFWAKKGEDRRLRMFFRPRPAETDSTEFLRFEVKAQSLLRRPDGTAIAEGDSVLITVTVTDLTRLVVDFQPSGLRFDPDEPARLKLEWDEAEDDLDDDGDVDEVDAQHATELSIWRRESATQPWVRLATNVQVELQEVEADILGFTNYAIAYRR